MNFNMVAKRWLGYINHTMQRRMLFWSIGFFILAIATLSVTIFWVGQTELVNQTRQRNVQMASMISREINAQISNILAETRAFTRYLENTDPSPEMQAEAALSFRLSSPRYLAIYYFDIQGTVIFQLADTMQNLLSINGGSKIISRAVPVIDQEVLKSYKTTVKAGVTSVSDVYFKSFGSVPVLSMGMPIMFAGGTTRILVFEIDLTDIWQRIYLSSVGNTGFTYIVSRDGIILDYPNASYVGTVMPKSIQSVLQSYEGFAEYRDPSNNNLVLAAYSPVGGLTGWGIVVVQNKSEINKPILRIGLFIIGIASLLALIGVISILFMIRTFTRPIIALTEITHRIAETGELTQTDLKMRPDEIGRLSEAFDLMLDRLEKSEVKLAHAAAEERNRLARDLHDAVSQTLFSASLIADVLPRIWERNPVEGRKRLEELRMLTRGALAEMRTLLLELRPAALFEAEAGHLLHQLAESITGRSRIPVDVLVKGECTVEPEIKIAYYRIAQEALNNVAKHSNATKASVILTCEPEALILNIKDNGQGFDIEDNSRKSLGLGIIKERVKEIGALLDIKSKIGKGTDITITWHK